MNMRPPASKKIPAMGYGDKDADILRRSEVAEHIAQLIAPIRDLSETADLTYLTYLLDMASEEAKQMRGKLKTPK